MNIALISEHASPLATLDGADSGAQNVYVAHLARELGRVGHKVDVFTRRDAPTLPPAVPLVRNVRVINVPAGPPSFVPKERLLQYMDEFANRLVALAAPRFGRYDIVHANFFMSGIASLRLRRKLGIPFVTTFHGLARAQRIHQANADAFVRERVDIEQALVASSDRILAECPQDREDLVALYNADPQRIDIVPCGYDPSELRPGPRSVRRRLGLREDEFVVLQLGRLVPPKSVDTVIVIRGIAELKRAHGIVARLLIVGGDSEYPDPVHTPEIGRLRAVAGTEGVAEQVLFIRRPTRSALRDYYCGADVFVSTPSYEPSGITPLEAMACGRPVIGTAVGGIKHAVVDAVTGYLVPPNDPVALAERLARFHRNPELGRAFGRAGIRHVRSAFTWNRIALQLARVYAAVLAPHGARLAATVAGS